MATFGRWAIAALVFAAVFSPAFASESEMDKKWMEYLTEAPPPEAVAAASNLTARAASIARSLSAGSLDPIGEVDMVVSGGGNLDAFYMGMRLVIERLPSEVISVQRWAGVSAGGEMPFELALKGTETTLLNHLSYRVLTEQNPDEYWTLLSDHHWRLMAKWMTEKWNSTLSTLDERVFMGTSCLAPLPKLVLVSKYTSPSQAASAFMATGTVYEWYDGKPCSDGGATSGANMTPLFQDGARDQVVVNLMKSGFPTSVVFKNTLTKAIPIIEAGMDTAKKLFACGASKKECWTDALSVCPKGSDTSSNVCK